MPSWFQKRVVAPGGVEPATEVEAYREGRIDERDQVRHSLVSEPVADRRALDEAYDRGRREERLRRRGSPLLSLLVLIVVIIGGLMIYLAVRNGSFSSGGAVVDRDLSRAAQTAQAPIKDAADKTGDALQSAGQSLKRKAGSNGP